MSIFLAAFFLCFAWAQHNPTLPPPYATSSVAKNSKVIGWPKGLMPVAPAGFKVSLFASLESPRSLYVLPNGDVLVSQGKKVPADSGEKSPDRITVFRMNGSQLKSKEIFAKNLKLPFGMALWKNQFFVGTAEKILVFDYKDGHLVDDPREIAKIPFAKPQRHWTRHLLINPTNEKLLVSVGSVSNVGEPPDPLDPHNAAILEMNRDGNDLRIYASGLRNAVSMAWEPIAKALWAVVNERDELGDDLPPDYITHVIEGGFYGWPYAYWGKHEDPRQAGKHSDLVAKSLTPDFAVGAHTAALGITFTTGTKLLSPFNQGALITQHGSWNRSKLVGYRVMYVAFDDKGVPIDGEKDFLSGFIADQDKAQVYGRPVAAVVLADGSVLITDDGAGKIWRVSPK